MSLAGLAGIEVTPTAFFEWTVTVVLMAALAVGALYVLWGPKR